MCEPSILLPLKCGVQSTGLGVGQGPWSLVCPSCGKAARPFPLWVPSPIKCSDRLNTEIPLLCIFSIQNP